MLNFKKLVLDGYPVDLENQQLKQKVTDGVGLQSAIGANFINPYRFIYACCIITKGSNQGIHQQWTIGVDRWQGVSGTGNKLEVVFMV